MIKSRLTYYALLLYLFLGCTNESDKKSSTLLNANDAHNNAVITAHKGPLFTRVPIRNDFTAGGKVLAGTWFDVSASSLTQEQLETAKLPDDFMKLEIPGVSKETASLSILTPSSPISGVENSGKKGKHISTSVSIGNHAHAILALIQLARLVDGIIAGSDGWARTSFTLNKLNEGYLGENLPPLNSTQYKSCGGRENLASLIFDEFTAYFSIRNQEGVPKLFGCMSVWVPEKVNEAKPKLQMTLWNKDGKTETVTFVKQKPKQK